MFEKIIRKRGKSFDNLSAEDVALMVEADSALTSDGNDYFSSCALDEFLYSADVKRPDLIAIREHILKNIYLESDSTRKRIDVQFLRTVAEEIRSGQFEICDS